MEDICGDCKYFLPHRRDKQGFEGKCKEIVIRQKMTDLLISINLRKTDKSCQYFDKKTVYKVLK